MMACTPAHILTPIITGAAAILGAAVGSVSTQIGARFEGKQARGNRRRGVHQDFIAATQQLTRPLLASETMKARPPPASTLGANIAAAVGAIDRARTAVVLDSSDRAKEQPTTS